MFDATFIENPYPTYAHLLASGRLHWVDFLGGAWLVPHYDDAIALLRSPHVSASRTGAYLPQFTDEQRAQLQPMQAFMGKGLVALDGEPHLRLRRLLSSAFTPRTVEALRPRVQQIADELIDELAANEDGTVELMSAFAHPLPALVIAELMGVPREDQAQFITWSDELAVFITSAHSTFEMALQSQAALVAMMDYFRAIAADRREHPRDDLISLLTQVEEQGDVLDEAELLVQCVMFFFAGHETTRNLIGNGLLALLEHPEQRALLEHNPALIRGAVDEMLRYNSPAQIIPRVATEDFEFQGQPIRAGQAFVIMVGAANRDPEVFAEPDRFDIARMPNRPLSFGYGAHSCLGMTLAQMEAQIAIQTLLRRLPSLRLVEDAPDWANHFAIRGLRTLPLAFDPTPAQVAPAPVAIELGGCPFHARAA